MEKTSEEKINSYLVFRLATEEFAVSAANVIHILEVVKITEVPNSPVYMKGLINLRGAVLPVIDARLKFGLPVSENTIDTSIVVVEFFVNSERVEVGAYVDAVVSVNEYLQNQILKNPSVSKSAKSDFVKGMVEYEGRYIKIIDVEKVFATDEVFSVDSIASNSI